MPIFEWLLKTGFIVLLVGVRGDGDFFASLVVNGEKRIEAVVEGIRSAQDLQGGNTILIKLNKGDTMWVQRYAGYGTTKLESYVGVRVSTFSGVLLNPVE